MAFYLPPPSPREIFEPTAGRVEGFPYRDVDIFVRLLDEKIVSRKGQLDLDAIEQSLMLMPVRGFNHHPASRDLIVIRVQIGRLSTDFRFRRR